MTTEAKNSVVEKVSEVVEGNGGNSMFSALKSKELLIPAALSAASALAASKGPNLVRRLSGEGEDEAERLGERAAEAARNALGGGILGNTLKKAVGGGGKKRDSGEAKKTRRLPIERWTDVAVPVNRAYEAWTKFEQYPNFMHRVLSVEQKGEDRVAWQEKVWFSTREWEGRITERRPNDRIAWKTTNGLSHRGIVSFHRLEDNLTRVMVTMEFEPHGMLEKMASGLRFVNRAVQSDLARFKAFVEIEDAKGLEYRPIRQERSNSRRVDRSSKDDETRMTEWNERQNRREQRRKTAARS